MSEQYSYVINSVHEVTERSHKEDNMTPQGHALE
jgi:hypothetical protein